MVINFTFICMSSDFSRSDSSMDVNNNTKGIDYTPTQKAAILWAIPIGILFGSIPVNYFYTKYGARWPFFVAGMLSVVSTAAMPPAAKFDLKALLALRLVQEHRLLTQAELGKIRKGKTTTKHDDFVPYKEVFTNKVILIVWLNAFAFMVALQFLLAYAPTYFSSVLGYDVAATGSLSSMATAIHLPMKVAGGIISDNLMIVPERYKMWFFNTLSAGLAGVCTFLIGVFPSTQPMTGVVMFTLTITFMALNAGSVYKCGTLCASPG
ncbi:hypothetical protein OESDEN_02476 [Oesophagostomum dentatum]|uniref:Major facilitator superfamily (MFS) profile domain-containing protein n=1 Tax=Oesophagostomum dentatum TaxID=61180 RepID=A0A0B1TN68_OESDE|nr:hypothetical protein OESDEN_02476 [Oesophagostomum dentatum]